jgi:hypothetical protein
MAFVNEYISDEDIEKYDIEELNKKFHIANYKSTWTVNHEKDIYLRHVRRGREEHSDEHKYYFYWQGQLIDVVLKQIGGGELNGPQWYEYELLHISISKEHEQSKPQIIAALKEALTAYKSSGLFSTCTTFSATFNF